MCFFFLCSRFDTINNKKILYMSKSIRSADVIFFFWFIQCETSQKCVRVCWTCVRNILTIILYMSKSVKCIENINNNFSNKFIHEFDSLRNQKVVYFDAKLVNLSALHRLYRYFWPEFLYSKTKMRNMWFTEIFWLELIFLLHRDI